MKDNGILPNCVEYAIGMRKVEKKWEKKMKQRLIDAEEVKQYALTEGFYCDTDADKEATAEKIDQLFPTVEAIPIEWIKKKLDKLKDDIKWAWYYGNVALKEMEWAETWVQIVLLEEWEKENGTDRQE